MNNLERHFSKLSASGQKAAVFFITAGDPSSAQTPEIMRAVAEAGADCIELGVPFSDPIADGPIIQRSTARALTNRVTLDDLYEIVQQFRRDHNTPVVMMGYYNPLLRYGLERAVSRCREAGIDGLIVADLPFEEGGELEKLCRRAGVSLIYLLAPDIDPKRTRSIVRASRGFVYCVAQYGTTGVDSGGDSVLPETIRSLQSMSDLPVLLGFGISSLEGVREKSRIADGVIIGSWLIQTLESATEPVAAAGAFVRAVRQALDA